MDTQQITTSNPRYIGIPKRLLAMFIDNFVTIIVTTFVVFGQTQPQSPAKILAYLVVAVLIAGAYFVLLESSAEQATLGKMALGIMVTNSQGKKLTVSQAVIRYLSKGIWVIVIFIAAIFAAVNAQNSSLLALAGLVVLIAALGNLLAGLMVLFNPEKQALHDRIAKTFVIDVEDRPGKLPQKALLQIAAIALISGLLFHLVPSSPGQEGSTPPSPLPGLTPQPSPISKTTTINLCGVQEEVFSPVSFIDGVWQLQFSVGSTVHLSTLTMRGESGTMQTEYFDDDTNEKKAVVQTIKLRQSPSGFWLFGADPVDATTKKPADRYIPDNIYRQKRPDGSFVTFNCVANQVRLPASMNFIRD
ncbi:RDD family protein [Leptolyngbya sp. AN03gr2]|uniref:RDD family protein n=1 Tax=unclassified Leptolyngbya TaxID=2650499 RepID=UPI003D31C579